MRQKRIRTSRERWKREGDAGGSAPLKKKKKTHTYSPAIPVFVRPEWTRNWHRHRIQAGGALTSSSFTLSVPTPDFRRQQEEEEGEEKKDTQLSPPPACCSSKIQSEKRSPDVLKAAPAVSPGRGEREMRALSARRTLPMSHCGASAKQRWI